MSGGPTNNRLADYFCICGLHIPSGLEPDQLSGENLHCTPLKRPYKCKTLAYYPQAVPGNPFDEVAVSMLCQPRGLRFANQHDKRMPKFHSFIITKEDGSRVFGSTYTFYEKVQDRQICTAMQTLHQMHLAELSNEQSRTLYSHLGPVHKRSPKSSRRSASPRPPGHELYDMKHDTLYVTRCLCFISQLPLTNTFRRVLELLYKAVSTPERPSLPLESYIYNILHEAPLPPPGRSIKLFCLDQPIVCQRPGVTELPLLEYPIREMLELLGMEIILGVFTSVLLEHQVLIYSKDYQRLMLVAEGITALVFPFTWQHVYVPILPASLLHFLDAPVPFIMGLHHAADNDSLRQLISQANMCVLDIDAGMVELPEDLPAFPYRQELTNEVNKILASVQLTDSKNTLKSLRKSRAGRENGNATDVNTQIVEDPNSRMEFLQQSEALARLTAIARKTGVTVSLQDISDSIGNESKSHNQTDGSADHFSAEVKEMLFNNSVREAFLACFLQMFSCYENFVIQPPNDMEMWLSNRDSMHSFDKAAFLSDQPEVFLPFLSPFLESQMFTTLIDNKILSMWEEPDWALRLFEVRLKSFREQYGDSTTLNYHLSEDKTTEMLIEKRATVIDHVLAQPQSFGREVTRAHEVGVFPLLDAQLLNAERVENRSKRDAAKWRRRDRIFQHSQHVAMSSDQRERYIQEARTKSMRQPKLSDMNPTVIQETNWKFVEALLREVKSKTKRLLVEKMGQEAVELGHGEQTITGVEENTLIATLCDLLERVWSHGQHTKQGRSPLWSHLRSFQEVEQCNDGGKPIDPNYLTPDISSMTLSETDIGSSNTWPRRHRRKGSQGPEIPTLQPLPVAVTFDVRNIQQMLAVKTDNGCARAWVRLALEKKMLSRHLKELLSDTDLLRSLYKRYAFLRCEDEREQFLYHLLSLNAVDYYCFTNTFTEIMVPYRILLFPNRRTGFSTTANVWLCVSGQLGETGTIDVPKNQLQLTVQHKNLGILTTLRLGHDNTGMSPRWLIEHVLVRNEITGHTYKFPCGRWLGKGIDDGSSERLLVAQIVPATTDNDELMNSCLTPPRCMSPSVNRKSPIPKMQISEIQEMLGDAVNNLVKHFYKPERERGSITVLLCGEYGLVYCMENVFQCGFRSSRLFRNKFFTWDFIEKVQQFLESLLNDVEARELTAPTKAACHSMSHVVNSLNKSGSLGKDGKFQIFICVGVRDHLLLNWIKLMSQTPVASTMYEEKSFFRDKSLLAFLIHILDSLKEFNITLEASLTKGIADL